MGWFNSSKEESKSAIEWKSLQSIEKLDELINDKSGEAHLFFKHSTRCGISSMAKSKFEREWDNESKINLWYLDLLNYREISGAIAEKLGVYHQSPQAILIQNGEVLYQETHGSIDAKEILKKITS
jgi:bacillithiol system protein YtxJ